MEPVSAFQCGYAGRCAREQQIAGFQLEQLRQPRNDLGAAENHLGDVGALALCAVHIERERRALRMTDFARAADR